MPDSPALDALLGPLQRAAGDMLQAGWERIVRLGAMGPDHRRGRRFGHLGAGSAICFPVTALFGERYISIGAGTVIGPYASLSAGVAPGHVPDHDPVIRMGDRCVIGKGSGIVGQSKIEIGDDVWTGHHVYVTDANHGYRDTTVPIGVQFAAPRPVSIGSGSWLGHGTIVLPGSTIGRNVVAGAGTVVASDLPDFCVAVGNPARVIRRYVDGEWVNVDDSGEERAAEAEDAARLLRDALPSVASIADRQR
ncbi:MAG TPA: acyltransferase [Acidimicrobiia bacterium]